jgi:hypothetical protein
MSIETLRERYPWPASRPTVKIVHPEIEGWFAGANRKMLGALIDQRGELAAGPIIILELGSFRGLSSKFLAERSMGGDTLICVDHWLGSEEHHRRDDWRELLSTLYEVFLSNLWGFRDRVVPMRTTTLDGMKELQVLGIMPDIIYVDAAHDTESVYRDITTAQKFFPDAEICGDDWMHHSVRTGVVRAAEGWKLLDVQGCCAWHLKRE